MIYFVSLLDLVGVTSLATILEGIAEGIAEGMELLIFDGSCVTWEFTLLSIEDSMSVVLGIRPLS